MSLASFVDEISKEDLNQSGIYCIRNLSTNKIYIGSAINFYTRFIGHRQKLINKEHHSKHLQASYNKYTQDVFKFQILEIVPEIEIIDDRYLFDLEQSYLNATQCYRGEKGYNASPMAGGTRGYKWNDEQRANLSRILKAQNRKMSPEHKAKLLTYSLGSKRTPEQIKRLSDSHKGYKFSEERKLALSLSKKGIRCTEATKLKIGKANARKQFCLLSPTKEIYYVNNLTEFCKRNKLCVKNISCVARGKTDTAHGWKCKIIHPTIEDLETINKNLSTREERRKKRFDNFGQEFIITFPNGEQELIRSLSKFCKKYNLDTSSLVKVAKGKLNHFKNYKADYFDIDLFNLAEQHRLTKKNIIKKTTAKKYIVINPQKEEYVIEGLTKFCKENNLNQGNMSAVMRNLRNTHKGWKCKEGTEYNLLKFEIKQLSKQLKQIEEENNKLEKLLK